MKLKQIPEFKKIRADAHAKVILLGEHFVLPWTEAGVLRSPGCTALALPLLNLKTEVEIASCMQESKYEFELCPACGLQEEVETQKPLFLSLMQKALERLSLRLAWDLEAHPCRVTSRSFFPISRGLGSSASFAVALTRAFCAYTQISVKDLFPLVHEVENLFHGQSSGLDTAAVLSDSPVIFRGGQVLGSFAQCAGDFVVVDSSPRLNSARWIEKTVRFRADHPKRWSYFSSTMDECSRACAELLGSAAFGQAEKIAQLLDQAHGILKELGLVTDSMESILRLGKKCGALSGKMSGAGGGGALIFLAEPGEGVFLAAKLQEAGISVLTYLAAPHRQSQYSQYMQETVF